MICALKSLLNVFKTIQAELYKILVEFKKREISNTVSWRSRTLVGYTTWTCSSTVTKEDFLCEDFFIITQH